MAPKGYKLPTKNKEAQQDKVRAVTCWRILFGDLSGNTCCLWTLDTLKFTVIISTFFFPVMAEKHTCALL